MSQAVSEVQGGISAFRGGAQLSWDQPGAGSEVPKIYRRLAARCSRTGYKGRVALHEVPPITERIERLAVERASSAAIATAAREEGMQTLRSDGLAKVLAGVTSLDEVLRVVV